jgi:hypothetical protein
VDGTSNTFTELTFFSPKGLEFDTSIPTKEGQTNFFLAGGSPIFQGSVQLPQFVPGDFSFSANLLVLGVLRAKPIWRLLLLWNLDLGRPFPCPPLGL